MRVRHGSVARFVLMAAWSSIVLLGCGDSPTSPGGGGAGGDRGGGVGGVGGAGGLGGGGGDALSPLACDGLGGDADEDNWCHLHDNCPDTPNIDQSDVDDDGVGDACDVEECDGMDNDGDELVDEEFADVDDDGVADCVDVCPGSPDTDTDFDGIADCADSCPLDPLNDQDRDNVCGEVDNCPAIANFSQSDRDGDTIGDHCDVEECDGISNDADTQIDEGMPDEDEDGLCDEIDPCLSDPLNDADLDEVCGLVDNCPSFANTDQADEDDDGWGDACDVDAAVHCDPPAPLSDPGIVPLPSSLEIGGIAAAAGSDTFYVALSSTSANYPNSVIAVDAPSASVLWSVFVGIDPQALALADDGSYLYVDLDVSALVRVINVPTREACRSFALGLDRYNKPLRVGEMEVLPGSPETIVVSTRRGGVSPDFGGVFVYDHGNVRPVSTRDHTGAREIAVASDTTVYGYNSSSTEFGFREMEVATAGITEIWNLRDLIDGFNADIVYDGGRVYSSQGHIVDVSGPFLVGEIPTSGGVAVEASVGEVFFVTSNTNVSVYDTTTLAWKRDIVLPSPLTSFGNRTLHRWGVAGLVAASDNALTILEDAFP